MSIEAVRTAVAEGNGRLAKALAAKDFAGAARLYSETGMVIPPDGQPIRGRAAIEMFWAGAVAALGLTGARLETVDLELSGDGASAHEVGKAELKVGGGDQTAWVNYVVVWQKGADGAWRLHRDIWNSRGA